MAEPCPSVSALVELSDALNPPLKRKKKRFKRSKPPKKCKSDNHFEVNILKRHSSENVDTKNVHSRPKIDSSKPAPFSDEPEAVAERDNCNYSIKITKELIESGTALPRPVRVYSDGIYDLFHQGHARQLMQAKNAFPEVHLVVGIHDDFVTHQLKGKTVMSDQERYECVRHCRYVDEVLRAAPWVTNDEFLEENKIDFVAHDAIPYAMGTESDDVYNHLKVKGIFVATERTEGISTSDLVNRVVQDCDTYARQSLDQGCKRKDMNTSLLNEKKYLLQNSVDKIKNGLKRKREEFIYSCKRIPRDFIRGFRYFFTKERC